LLVAAAFWPPALVPAMAKTPLINDFPPGQVYKKGPLGPSFLPETMLMVSAYTTCVNTD
jgi:hypothetical protein